MNLFVDRMLRRLFGPKSREVAGDRMKLCNYELRTLQ
jgi:hypothetical protein